MKIKAILLSAVLLSLGLSSTLRADTYTYSYTGNPFGYDGSFGEHGLTGVQGSITLSAPLAADTTTILTLASLGGTIESYSFTDGYAVWDTANYAAVSPYSAASSQFTVTTNDNTIVAWDVDIYGTSVNYSTPGEITTCTSCNAGTPLDSTNVYANYDAYSIPSTPGTWSVTDSITNTPEPSSLLMLSGGLIGLGFLRRRLA